MNMLRLAVALFLSASFCLAAQAEIEFFTDEATWATTVGGNTQDFIFTATNVALADEVDGPPTFGSFLGQNLTFQSDLTAVVFDFGFQNSSPDAGTEIVFTANGLGSSPTSHHDWTLTTGPLDAPTEIGIEIFTGGAPTLIDAITVFDVNGVQLGSFTSVGAVGGETFIGITSDDPIGSILYDDNPTSGGQVLKRFVTVSIPEVSTFTCLLTAAIFWFLPLRRRSQ